MPQKPTPEEIELKSSIQEAIKEIAADKELQKVKSLSRHNPMKVAEILYLVQHRQEPDADRQEVQYTTLYGYTSAS
jgi:hypothetical protein